MSVSADDYIASVKWPGGKPPAGNAALSIKSAVLLDLLRHAYNRGAADALAPLADAAKANDELMPEFMRAIFKPG